MPILNLDYSYVPIDSCVDGLKRYFENHIKPGGFLAALLENDFASIVSQADPVNRTRLVDWAHWLRNEPSMQSHGSKEKVAAWLAMQLPLER